MPKGPIKEQKNIWLKSDRLLISGASYALDIIDLDESGFLRAYPIQQDGILSSVGLFSVARDVLHHREDLKEVGLAHSQYMFGQEGEAEAWARAKLESALCIIAYCYEMNDVKKMYQSESFNDSI